MTLRLLGPAFAAVLGLVPVASVVASEGELDSRNVAGVYKRSFHIDTVDDGRVSVEDVLEIVQYSQASVYIRTRLHFHNGHTCNLWGIAEARGSVLVYRSGVDDHACMLTISNTSDRLVLDDPTGNCRASRCGIRGGFSSASFQMSQRRDIRYMSKILQSSQYKEAVAEYARVKNRLTSDPVGNTRP